MAKESGKINSIVTVLAVLSCIITFCACNSETEPEACLKPLMTLPPSYSENLCPSEFNFYTFVCDASSQYISWNFNNEIEETYFGNRSISYLEIEGEYRGQTSDYEYYVALPLLQSRSDGNFSMRTMLNIHAHNLTQFPVNCSTHCGQEMKNRSVVFRVAEFPKAPQNVVYYDPNKNKNNNCTGPKAVVKWDPPENSKGFTLSHYEYKYYETEKFGNEAKIVKRFESRSYWLDRNPSKAYYFEVYAVDKCGRHGEIVLITIPAEENK